MNVPTSQRPQTCTCTSGAVLPASQFDSNAQFTAVSTTEGTCQTATSTVFCGVQNYTAYKSGIMVPLCPAGQYRAGCLADGSNAGACVACDASACPVAFYLAGCGGLNFGDVRFPLPMRPTAGLPRACPLPLATVQAN